MQAYAFDLATVVGPMREALFPTLLLINQLALEGSPFTIALDSRDFICVTRTQRIDHAEGEAFLDDLDYLLSQALEIRQLTSNLALHGGEMDIDYEESATTVESSFTESISP